MAEVNEGAQDEDRKEEEEMGSAESQRYPFMLHGCLAAALVLPCKKKTMEEDELKVGLSLEPVQSTNPLRGLRLATFSQSIQSIPNPLSVL